MTKKVTKLIATIHEDGIHAAQLRQLLLHRDGWITFEETDEPPGIQIFLAPSILDQVEPINRDEQQAIEETEALIDWMIAVTDTLLYQPSVPNSHNTTIIQPYKKLTNLVSIEDDQEGSEQT